MIITGISAENVLKYRQLELHDLPESGIIAIEGVNESGKSTIGEIICFALFGRTYSLGSEGLCKLIRWGEPRCSVTILFRAGNNYQFEIARMLDRDGNQGARLSQIGVEGEPIARGTDAVNNTLCDLLGFGYDEFIESFYLAQREISTPHPHSHAVKAMAGLTHMEYVDYEYSEEIAEQQEAIKEGRSEIDQAEEAMAGLAIDPDRLSSLETEREALQKTTTGIQTAVDQLEQASTAYQDTLPEIRAVGRSRGRAKKLRFLSLLLSLALLGGWFLFDRMPESEYSQTLSSMLSGQIPQWGPQYIPWLLYGGIVFGALFLLFWFRAVVLKGRSMKLQEVSRALANQLNALHRDAPATESGETGAEAVEASSDESPVGEAQETAGSVDIIQASQRIATAQAKAAEVRELVSRELSRLRQEIQQRQGEVGHLEQAVATEKERVDKAASLVRLREGLEQNIAELQQHINLRELGRELLQGAFGYQSQQFNRELRELVGHSLPMFTEGRYEHLQIDEDLTVRVFSSDKRDFMDLEEISSGTQRQIMLAVRLALSQELVNSTVEGKQFIFLDEPFAFFDQQRTSNALKVLPELSDSITQVWIVAQSFPPDQTFDLQIPCTREQQTLSAVL